MKKITSITALATGAFAIFAAAVTSLSPLARADPVVSLGAASDFSVLAAQGITVAGAVDTTTIAGNIGSAPTPSITGLENVVLGGTNEADNGVTTNAQGPALSAYNIAAGISATTAYGPIVNLGGLTLTPGVYYDPSSIAITGTLTLDGTANSVFVIQAGSTLTAESGSDIVLEGGALAGNVFWTVGSSATLGTDAAFQGAILANTSITLDTGASEDGQLVALNGAVTLDDNNLTLPAVSSVPDNGSTLLLLGVGLAALLAFRRRFNLRFELSC